MCPKLKISMNMQNQELLKKFLEMKYTRKFLKVNDVVFELDIDNDVWEYRRKCLNEQRELARKEYYCLKRNEIIQRSRERYLNLKLPNLVLNVPPVSAQLGTRLQGSASVPELVEDEKVVNLTQV